MVMNHDWHKVSGGGVRLAYPGLFSWCRRHWEVWPNARLDFVKEGKSVVMTPVCEVSEKIGNADCAKFTASQPCGLAFDTFQCSLVLLQGGILDGAAVFELKAHWADLCHFASLMRTAMEIAFHEADSQLGLRGDGRYVGLPVKVIADAYVEIIGQGHLGHRVILLNL